MTPTHHLSPWRPVLFLLMALACSLGCLSCQPPPEVTVYADPWAGDYATQLVEAFAAAHPQARVQLELRSSEVIAQRLHFGDPMDLALLLDSTLLDEKQLWRQVTQSVELARPRLVLATRKAGVNPDLKGAGGTSVPAWDRPLHRTLRTWLEKDPDLLGNGQQVTANFFEQEKAYLMRGWVRDGIVLDWLVRQNPGQLQIRSAGPRIPGGLKLLMFKQSQNRPLVAQFYDFCLGEKSRQLLADLHIIP